MTEEEKIGKVHRALRRIGDITDGYVFSFSTIAKELQPVHLELKRLMFLLTCIIQEGNTLEPNAVKVDKEAFKHPEDIVNDENKATEEAENEVLQKEEHAITENDASAEENGVATKEEEVSPYDGYETSKTSNPELRPRSPRAKENEEAPVPAESSPEAHTPYQKDTIEPSIDDSAPNDLTFPDPFITRPPTPRHPHTPTWKHALRHLNIANLYVGDLEIQIFKEVLALARDVQHALVKVVRLCEELGARAAGKQDTWNEWKEVVEGWNAKERGDDGDRYGF